MLRPPAAPARHPGAGDRDPATPAGRRPAWHALPVDEVATLLRTDPVAGLALPEATRRLATTGPNELAGVPQRAPWRVFADQFRNLLILILLVAAVVAGLVGDLRDTAVIGVVLLFNAVLGFNQEYRAERSLAALREMLVAHARVRRAGRQQEVPAADLVPGDVVLLEAGDRVPADGRVVLAAGAEVDESSLTGESVPVAKSAETVRGDVAAADRTDMAYLNTVVTRGRLELAVTETGMRSRTGRLADLLQEVAAPRTPLQVQLDDLGTRLAALAGAAVALFLTLELLRGEELSATLLKAVALAVAAVPEGLPAVLTVTLSMGTYALARRGAIVRRLASVETLGCTSVICSDKTGTLTMNQMTARSVFASGTWFQVTGEGYGDDGVVTATEPSQPQVELHQLARAAVLCNDSVVVDAQLVGDPTEGALVVLARKLGLDVEATRRDHPRLAEVPFDSGARFMATFHDVDGRPVVLVKGAWEALRPRAGSGTPVARTGKNDTGSNDTGSNGTGTGADEASVWDAAAERMARSGLRVLAFAAVPLPPGSDPRSLDEAARSDRVAGLRVLGLVGLLDPPRPEAREAIARCQDAGIAVKMITGDHVATAQAVAVDLGIPGAAVTGIELDALDDDQLIARIEDLGVVARVAPEHKVRIVAALQARGRVVAMTGDGVNDAPALRRADIGVAMGRTGTEVSKEAAAMVLTDDNFATIVGAVEQGRTVYDNIVKFVRFQLPTNLGAILAMVAAPLVGLPVPFTAIQLLWINIIMDGPPAMALGLDRPQPGVMTAPPRHPSARILSWRRLLHLTAFGAVMAAGSLGVLAGALTVTRDAEAHSLAFTTFVLFQVFNVLNARNEHGSALGRHTLTNYRLWCALAVVVAMQVAVVELPALQPLFSTTELSAGGWAVAVVVAFSILLLEELRKTAARRLSGRSHRADTGRTS
ncbi:MAG: HAD-IC family P-type ATPase [Nocardioidaceae bacterium]